jgi:enoyl-CoA hydratase/carnithine racemase
MKFKFKTLQFCFSKVLKRNYLNIKVQNDNYITNITLSNPKKRNVLTKETLLELNSALEFNKNNTKVIVLSSEGNVFSAGHDLKELTKLNKEEQLNLFQLCSEINLKIKNINVPVNIYSLF